MRLRDGSGIERPTVDPRIPFGIHQFHPADRHSPPDIRIGVPIEPNPDLGLVVAGSIATGSALAGPPGVPTTEREPANEARKTETENRDGVAIIDLRRAPSEARPILETRESLDAAWRPSPAVRNALEIRRLGDWLVVAGPETAVGLFRSWYAELLATTTPGVAVDIRVIELGDAPSTPALLDDIRRDPAGDAPIALAAAVPPDGPLVAEARLVVPRRPGTPSRDDSGRSTSSRSNPAPSARPAASSS